MCKICSYLFEYILILRFNANTTEKIKAFNFSTSYFGYQQGHKVTY